MADETNGTSSAGADEVRESARSVFRSRRSRGAGWWVIGVLAGLTLVARALSSAGWAFDMIASFAAPIAAVAGVLGVLALVMRRWLPAVMILLVAGGHVLWLTKGRAARAPASAPAISVMAFNALGTNTRHEAVVEMILAESADVVAIVECSFELSRELEESEPLGEVYPYRSLAAHENQWAMAKLSKHPMVLIETDWEGPNDPLKFNYVHRRTHVVRSPQGEFVFMATIADSPTSPSRWASGNEQLERNIGVIESSFAELGRPLVLAGDLNATPPGRRTAMLRRRLGLLRAKPLWRFAGTWPASLPPVLRVAIDDVLVSEGVRVAWWRTVERETGSDHAPVVAGIVLE